MTHNLRSAYALLRRFKEGSIFAGAKVTPRQLALVRLLAKDLLPNAKLPKDVGAPEFAALVGKLCEENTRVNRRWMRAVVLAQEAKKARRLTEGRRHLDAFIKECSSRWYRMHAEEAKKQL
jgi:hypothetical protein